jgi:MFS family permease
VWWPSLAGFALGSLLLGLPFTAITLFAMQEARRLKPHNASAFIGVLTAAYGLGQIAGPPMVALLLQRSAHPGTGLCAGRCRLRRPALVLGMAPAVPAPRHHAAAAAVAPLGAVRWR